MENAPRKLAPRGKERSRRCPAVPVAGYPFLVIVLAVLAGCATGGQARKASWADCEPVMAMIMEEDYEKALEFMDEWQNPGTAAAPEPGRDGGAEPESPSAHSDAPVPEAAPGTGMSEEPAAASPRSEGDEHGTSAKQ